MKTNFAFSLLILFCFFSKNGFSQSPGKLVFPDTSILAPVVTIIQISHSGNKKTKDYIIERELGLKEKDTIHRQNLVQKISTAQKRVYNLNLFNNVDISIINIDSASVLLDIQMIEKWYFYPMPQFQIVDRSYNEWLHTYGGSLKRVVYGLHFAHYNLTGRRDPLRIYLLNGYQRNISFAYSQPYSNRKLSEGFGLLASFIQNKEITFATSPSNKLLQFKTNDFARNSLVLGANYSMRKNAYKRSSVSLSYNYQKLSDSLLLPKYNPNYFGDSTVKKGFVDLGYNFRSLNTNNNNFPLVGRGYVFSVSKRGFGWRGGVNMLTISAGYERYLSLGNQYYLSINSLGLLKLPFKQAYINQRAIGYDNFSLRGLDYYVVDAVAAAVVGTTLRKKILEFKVPMPKKLKIIPQIPFIFYAKTFADLGYAYNQQPYVYKLNNKMLYTGGVGIDVLTLYDMHLRVEYSLNQLGEKGLFLHGRNAF